MSTLQDPEEPFDVVDPADQVIGQAPRWRVHAEGLRHRAVHVWIADGAGRLLLQQRAATKDTYPGRWTSSVSGHLDAGEGYAGAARRELGEELGWREPLELRELGRAEARPETEQEFVVVYAARADGPFAPAPGEVAELRWFLPAEVAPAMAARPGEYCPSLVFLWARFGPAFQAGSEAGGEG